MEEDDVWTIPDPTNEGVSRRPLPSGPVQQGSRGPESYGEDGGVSDGGDRVPHMGSEPDRVGSRGSQLPDVDRPPLPTDRGRGEAVRGGRGNAPSRDLDGSQPPNRRGGYSDPRGVPDRPSRDDFRRPPGDAGCAGREAPAFDEELDDSLDLTSIPKWKKVVALVVIFVGIIVVILAIVVPRVSGVSSAPSGVDLPSQSQDHNSTTQEPVAVESLFNIPQDSQDSPQVETADLPVFGESHQVQGIIQDKFMDVNDRQVQYWVQVSLDGYPNAVRYDVSLDKFNQLSIGDSLVLTVSEDSEGRITLI